MFDTTTTTKPTIVLVHGAFAESASWNDVIAILLEADYLVIAAANPLRGVNSDATYLASTLQSINGPLVLVGHSYGGAVITNAATGDPKVKALVYVAAFAPEAGESAANLTDRFPGSTLGAALAPPVVLGDGTLDLSIEQANYHAQFCADVPEPQAAQMAATQRPISSNALNGVSGTPAWKTIPSWFIFGDGDKNIPPAALRWMAERAAAQEIVEVARASHAIPVSRAADVATLVLRAASYVEQQAAPQPA